MNRTRAAFVAVFALLGVTLIAAAYGAGRGTGYLRVQKVPVYCTTLREVNHCLREEIVAQGAPSPTVSCARLVGKTGEFVCNIAVGGFAPSCYDAIARRATEGFPLLTSVTEKQC